MTTANSLSTDTRYKVEGYSGIAWYTLGYATTTTEESWTYDGEGDPDDEASYLYNEPEEIPDTDNAIMVMVGDDRKHTIPVEDLTPIADEDYCSCCGQIGCGWG